jgi:nucleoside-specific outer membrane channel protein Tsx
MNWSSVPPDAQHAILAALGEGDPWTQQAELTASDGRAQDGFGFSVAVSGSTVVVGSPVHPYSPPNQGPGAAYVFVESGGTWTQQAELTASDGVGGDEFGSSLAISGSTIVVGAPTHQLGSDRYPGAAYVFVESGGTWSQQAELTASDGASWDFFGNSVAINGTTIVVGAVYHKALGLNQHGPGAAYVFVENGGTWSQQEELTASDGFDYDLFGTAVAVSGSTAFAGAPRHTVGTNVNQGVGYGFAENGGIWTQQTELTPADGVAGDGFGGSIAIDGGAAVLGASTAVYVFEESGGVWGQQAELTPSGGTANTGFGGSLGLSGSTVVAGAADQDVGSNVEQGAAYVFVESGGTWNQQEELTASDGATIDLFGTSVGVSGGVAVVGAPGHKVGSNFDQGAAYVFVSPTVTLSPTSLGFGNQAVETTSAAKTVTLKNTGTTTLYNSSIAITAGNSFFAISNNTCGATLAAGKTCKVSVTFTPTQLAAETGTLTFTDNASGSPQTMSLSGTGVAQATLTPSSHTFPKTKVGSTSAPYNFTLRNNLSTTLTGISYSTAAPFAVSTSSCSTTLDSKKSCTISVTFSPTVTGAAAGTLTVNDSANVSPQTARVSGTGD